MTDTTNGFPFRDAVGAVNAGIRYAATKVINGFHFRKQINYDSSGNELLGQKTKALSLPVTPPTDPDYRPGSGDITARDIASSSVSGQDSISIVTGAPTAGSYQSWAINGFASVRLLVSNTWTGTLTIEGSIDGSIDGGTTWTQIPLRVVGTNFTRGSVTGNCALYGDVSGLTHLRARSTAAHTGTITVNPTFSAAGGPVNILNALRLTDNTNAATAAVLAASSTPAATDPQLVVGLHPNSVQGARTDAKSSATDGTSVSMQQVLKQISASVQAISPGGASAAVSVTRTNDTNVYAANDVIGAATGSTAALTFASIGPSGGEVTITSVSLEIDASAVISGETSYTLHLYNVTPPSALGDNAAFDLPSGDRASYLGFVNLGTPLDLGSTLYVQTDGVNKQIKLSSTSLFGYLVTAGGHTPTAQRVYVVTLHTM